MQMIHIKSTMIKFGCLLMATRKVWTSWFQDVSCIKVQWMDNLHDHAVRLKARSDGHSKVGCEPASSETIASTHRGHISFLISLRGGWRSISHPWTLPTFNYLISFRFSFIGILVVSPVALHKTMPKETGPKYPFRSKNCSKSLRKDAKVL